MIIATTSRMVKVRDMRVAGFFLDKSSHNVFTFPTDIHCGKRGTLASLMQFSVVKVQLLC